MRIGILTGGGDVPGLNTAIKGLVAGALQHGWQALGIRNGWQGLLELDADDPESLARWTTPLHRDSVRTIDRSGGTCLHSSRTHPGRVKKLPRVAQGYAEAQDGLWDCTPHVLRNLERLGIDVLFPIGGDDTLSYGERIHREGFKVIGIPKTMDNDVYGTDYCLGFATCVRRSIELIQDLRTCTGSHERFAVIEVMGRNAGFTALIPAYLASVDRALIAEVPFDMESLADRLAADRADNPSRYAMVIVSEGATFRGQEVIESGDNDAFGHRKLGGIGEAVGASLQRLTGVGIIAQKLGYMVRCGAPDPVDVMLTYNFANLAIELAARGETGKLVRVHQGVYGAAPMSIVSEGHRRVDVENFYDAKEYRPRIRSVLGLPVLL
jgi:6-phosphofructokinase 1